MPQELTHAPASNPTPMSQELRQEIERALTLTFSDTVTASQSVIDQASSWLERAQEAWAPASDEDRDAVLNVLASQPWWLPDALKIDRDMFFAVYHADLHDIPALALAEAAKQARLKLARFPTTGQLREFALGCEKWRKALRLKEGLRRLSKAKPPEDQREYVSQEKWAALMSRLKADA